MKWFRFYSEFMDDPKIGRLPEWQQLTLVKLMCVQAKGGLIPSYTYEAEEDLAHLLRISDSQWREVRDLFIEKGFLHRSGNGFVVTYIRDICPCDNRLPATEWRIVRERIFSRDDYTCQYCGSRGVSLQCDHVIPVSRGGSNDDSNLVTACKACNLSKNAKTPEEWREP